jgi:hypothetical protein
VLFRAGKHKQQSPHLGGFGELNDFGVERGAGYSSLFAGCPKAGFQVVLCGQPFLFEGQKLLNLRFGVLQFGRQHRGVTTQPANRRWWWCCQLGCRQRCAAGCYRWR